MINIKCKSLFGGCSLAQSAGFSVYGYKRVNGVYIIRIG